MPEAYILGLGRSGTAAARCLKRDGWKVTVGDRAQSDSLERQRQDLEREGIAVKLGHAPSWGPTDWPDLIVVSPGIPWDLPFLAAARRQGIDTIGELELAWRYLKGSPWIGITGTNGKTTTTALTAAIFQTAGLNAPSCGNIGHAACELALSQPPSPHPPSFDWIVAEISSYQIESSAHLSPTIGIWTTFTPDHLSRHKTLENYYQIKASLLRRCQHQVFNGDDPYLRGVGLSQWPGAIWTSTQGKGKLLGEAARGSYLEGGQVVALGEPICPLNSFRMVGDHNRQNLLMAVTAAKLAGIDRDAIAEAVASFPGVPHRLEYLCTLGGTDFINDSKATNYDAAAVGLASVAAPAILIAGGEAKEGDDRGWLQTIRARAAAVLLIGEAAPAFARRLQDAGYGACEIVGTLDKAVRRSLELAPQKGAKVVLLSPACASFDQYQSFEQRGDHFRQLCLQLQ